MRPMVIKDLLTVEDVASLLKVSQTKVRSLIHKKMIKADHFGKQWLIKSDDLELYIKQNNIMIEPDDHPRLSDEIPDIIALSFFSGAMGLDIGMEKAGIKPLLACECDKYCR